MVDRKEDQSTQFRDTSSGNFEQAAKTATQTQVDPSLADAQTVAQSLGVDLNTGLSQSMNTSSITTCLGTQTESNTVNTC